MWTLRVMVPGRGEVSRLDYDGGGWEAAARIFWAECLKAWKENRAPEPYGVLEATWVPHLFLWVADEHRDAVRVLSPQTNENRIFSQD